MILRTLFLILVINVPALGHAFCGFFVSGADSRLYNSASQSAIAVNADSLSTTSPVEGMHPMKGEHPPEINREQPAASGASAGARGGLTYA